MPNWASVVYVVRFGNEEIATKVYSDFEKVVVDHYAPIKSGFEAWLGNLFSVAGFSADEILNGDISCRGSVDGMDFIKTDNAIKFWSTMAWTDNYDSMVKLFKKYTDEFDLYMLAEETGCEYFHKVDPWGRYFNENYYIDVNVNEDYYTECYSTKGEVVDWLNETLNLDDKILAEKLVVDEFERDFYMDTHYDEDSYLYIIKYQEDDGYFGLG